MEKPQPGSSSSPPRRASSDSQTLQSIADELSRPLVHANGTHHHASSSSTAASAAAWVMSGGGDAGAGVRRKGRAMVILLLASTGSSLAIGRLGTRETVVSLAAVPFLVHATAAMTTRAIVAFAGWKGARLDGMGEGWRESWREAAVLGTVAGIGLWCRAEAAGKAGLGIWQAIEVFVSPVLLNLLPRMGLDAAMPSGRMQTATCLLALAISLALVSQSAGAPSLILSSLATVLSAVYLALVKRWFVVRQSTSALALVLRSAPFAALVSTVPSILAPSRRGLVGVAGPPPLHLSTYLSLLVVMVCELVSSFATALAFDVGVGPVALANLSPARNFVSLAVAPSLGVLTGVSNAAQLGAVYVLSALGLICFDPEARRSVGLGRLDGSPEPQQVALPTPATSDVKSPPLGAQTSHHRRRSSSFSDDALPPSRRRLLNLVVFCPFALWLGQQVVLRPDGLSARKAWLTRDASIDLVFSYYNEPVDDFLGAVGRLLLRPEIRSRSPRLVIYVKNNETDLEELRRRTNADEVNRLENVGREGATYLTHIMRHYNASRPDPPPLADSTEGTAADGETREPLRWEGRLGGERATRPGSDVVGLAGHTLFMQPHISWHWLAEPRIDMFDGTRTGFLSMGPYLSSDCGKDGLGNGEYERMVDIFVMFRETFCPPYKQLATYAGQMFVSRKRILANAYSKYSRMLDLIAAPPDHWLHHEGDWFKWKGSTDKELGHTHSAVAPFLGHALERSWPVIFGCVDPTIAELCTDDVRDLGGKDICQCFDA